jgi:hypothetical protein
MKRINPHASHGLDLFGWLLHKILLSLFCFMLVALALSAGCQLSSPVNSQTSAGLNDSLAGVSVEGVAVNGSGGAQVTSNQYHLRIADMPEWPNDIAGKRVRVDGKMRKTTDGIPAVHEAKWEVIDGDEVAAETE